MEGYFDMHCHILPGVDDGATDLEKMKEMLEIAYNDGIRYILATPHYHPKRGHESSEVLRQQASLVRIAAHMIDDNFRIYLGTEIFFSQDVVDKLKFGRILTINERPYILVEFSPTDRFQYIHQGLLELQMNGYIVILAHVERYECIVENPELAEHLVEMGIRLQINASSITGESGRKIKKFVRNLMESDLVYCVGTDAHGSRHRAPKMHKAAEYTRKKYGVDYMRKIFFENAWEVLEREN